MTVAPLKEIPKYGLSFDKGAVFLSYTVGKRVKAVMVERISIEAKMIALYLLREFVFEGKEIRNSNLLVDKKDFVFWVWG